MVFILAISSSLIIDILTKKIAIYYITKKISIIGDMLYLEYIKNSGIAFSIPVGSIILKLTTVLLVLFFLYIYIKNDRHYKSYLIDIGYGLLLGGAIGNGIERILNGEVVDFIAIKYFAIFNFADIFINIGVILIIIGFINIKGMKK